MFVAIVYFNHTEDSGPYDSHRDTKGWEAFLGDTKEEAIAKAELWSRRWESAPSISPNDGKKKYYGPYRILVAEIAEEVKRFATETKKYDEFDF